MKSLTLKTRLGKTQTISTIGFFFFKQLRYGTDSVKLPLKRQKHSSSNFEFNTTLTPKQQRWKNKAKQKFINLKNDQCKNSQHQLPQLSSVFFKLLKKKKSRASVVAYDCNPSIWQAEIKRLPRVWSQPGLQNKRLSGNQVYTKTMLELMQTQKVNSNLKIQTINNAPW